MKRRLSIVTLFVLLCSLFGLKAQDVALKTNLLYDVAASPSLGVEVGLAPRWTLDISGNVTAWKVKNHSWKQWMAVPEARYWFCERFQGHFVGVHAIGGQFNFGNIDHLPNFLNNRLSALKDRRRQGWGVGAGVSYGYSWILAKHWNIEAEIGIGWMYTRYDEYPCAECGDKIRDNAVHNYVGPTKAAVNLIYVF